jgi:hypothetical protein
MTIGSDPRGPAADPLTIVAELDPAPVREELQWWTRQLRERVNVRPWSGASTGVTNIQVEAAEDQLEAVARRLLAALDAANAVYPERYAVWRREHDAEMARSGSGKGGAPPTVKRFLTGC